MLLYHRSAAPLPHDQVFQSFRKEVANPALTDETKLLMLRSSATTHYWSAEQVKALVWLISYRKRVAAIQEAPPAEFLSEAWKEQEAGGGGISLPLPAIGAAVALLIFALIPFGDGGESYRDRDKGVESPAQIRARYQDAGYADGDYSQAAADAVDE